MRRRHLLNPRILGLRVSVLFGLYRRRLKYHAVRELLAGGGIAVGVALVFGVLVANASVLGSAGEVLHAVDGSASLELSARSPNGFSEEIAERAARLPDVQDAAPLLREDAVVQGPAGNRSVQLVGVTARLLGLRGSATRDLGAGALLLSGGVGLPAGVAGSIGAQTGGTVTVLAAGQAHPARVRVVLDSGAIGSLATSGLVVALLPSAQALAGEPGRVTEVLIRTLPGAERLVAGELRGLAAGRIDVLPANAELGLLDETAKPTDQSSALFAAIGLMVGFLLALNAMLLIVPERRRVIAEMRTQGYDPKQVILVFAFQAIALGLISSAFGVLIGEALARTLFDNAPIYLVVAFPISGHQAARLGTVLIAMGAGVAAALVASLVPIISDLTSKQPVDAVLHRRGEPGQAIGARTVRRLAITGATLVLGVSIAVRVLPGLAVAGGVLLALAALCLIPLAFRLASRSLRWFAREHHGGMLAIAVIELDAGATRAVALAGVAALAIYGTTAVDGARRDLTHGLDQTFTEYIRTADIWVTTAGNNLTVNNFPADQLASDLARAPGVATVRIDQGEYMDIGSRRMWIIARPPNNPSMLPAAQIIEGSPTRANALLRQDSYAALSSAFAAERHLRVGDTFSLPTPSGPAELGVAAITTNMGWPPGTITLSTADYSRYWQTTDPAALEVNLKPGVSPVAGQRTVESVLGGRPGLRVQTMGERTAQFQDNASQGLHSLAEIALLLLLTAALALAAALSTVIYQRRARFVSLKEDGFDQWQLWRGLLIESAVLLAIGCLDGAVLGIYGHALATRYLRLSTGFPAPFSVGGVQLVVTLLIVAGVALAIIAIAGYSAAGVSTTRSGYRDWPRPVA